MKSSRNKNNIDYLKSISKRLVVEDDKNKPKIVSDELGKAISELQVYQAELEMQNEELRLVQTELENSRNKYFELFNDAPTGYFLLDTNLIILEANVAALDLLGVSRIEIKDKPLLSYIRSKDHIRLISLLNDILELREPHHILVQVKRDNNIFRTIKIDGRLTEFAEIEGKQIMLSSTDLTELQKTQNALKESENIYRSLVQSSLDHIYMLSTDGYFLASNEQVDHFNVNNARELIGQNLSHVYPAETASRYIEKLHEVATTRKSLHFEHEIDVDGDIRHHIDRLYPVEKGDRLWAVGGISHDISRLKVVEREKRRLESRLRHSQKLESLGNLAGGIAHDFNNILSAILGYSELATMQVEEGSTIGDYLKEIHRGGKRARDLVQQILVFARQSREEFVPTNVARVAEEVVKFMRSSIPTTIEIQTDIESDSIILGNETQVYQILMNLCTNAYHAMEPDGGILKLTLKDVELKNYTDINGGGEVIGNYIEIQISDTGCGIDKEMIDFIFDPYFTTKMSGDGSGMGLAVVHSIVESYQGTISVQSKKGEGSNFKVLLPITIGPDVVSEKTSSGEDIPIGSETILFVDDETSITKMSKQILEQLGYSVITSNRSIEALKMFRQRADDFDLVITDMTMPYMTGDKLAAELLKIKPDIPIIICTGYSNKISTNYIEEIGIKAYATKPLIISQFAQVVRDVLDS